METQPNIRAAIARSRRARDAFTRRRRRLAIAASACIVASVPLALATLGVTGSDMVRAAENGAQNFAELLSKRSPGQRTTAQLTKTKKARALAKVRLAAPPGLVTPSATELARLLLPPAEQLPVDLEKPVALLQVAPPALTAIVNPPPGGVVESPPGGSGGSPPGGGGPGGGGPPLVTTQPETVPPAVPEPGTWATMLLGFGLLGWRLRRERRAQSAILPA